MPRIEEVCHDMDRRPEWDERVSRAEVLTTGPVRRGTVIRFDSDPAVGNVFSWDAEVVHFHYPSSATLEVIDVAPSSSFAGGSETWRFDGSAQSTRLTVVWEYRPKGLIGRLLDFLVGRRANAGALKQSLRNVKTAMEDEA